MSGARDVIQQRGAAIALLVVAVVVVILIASSGSQQHHVYVDVTEAHNVLPGQWVRERGIKVGNVSSVVPINHGHGAKITLALNDQAWPLQDGTTFKVKWGGTITYEDRQIELQRGPAGAPTLPDGARLSPSAFQQPVEFDSVLETFTPKLQGDIKSFLDNAGTSLIASRAPLRLALQQDRTPAALQQASAVVEDFNNTSAELTSLIDHGNRVVTAVQSANPGIGQLINGAANTLQAIAAQASGVQATLSEAPATLATTRHTLMDAETTLTSASRLADRLAPGAQQLSNIAAPLTSALRTLADVGPDAARTLATLRTATPSIDALLTRVTAAMPPIHALGTTGTVAVSCIRPYSPEIAGFFSNWDGFTSMDDGRNKYVRLMLQGSPYPSLTPVHAATLQKLLPQLRYAFPRPPGYNGGQPWLQPQCGAGPSALNASDNPMDRYTVPKTLISTNPPAR